MITGQGRDPLLPFSGLLLGKEIAFAAAHRLTPTAGSLCCQTSKRSSVIALHTKKYSRKRVEMSREIQCLYKGKEITRAAAFPATPHPSGNPQSLLCEFAQQTEKGERSHRGELARIRDLPHLFQTDCRATNAANLHCKRRFFGTFLTQESTVLPFITAYFSESYPTPS